MSAELHLSENFKMSSKKKKLTVVGLPKAKYGEILSNEQNRESLFFSWERLKKVNTFIEFLSFIVL